MGRSFGAGPFRFYFAVLLVGPPLKSRSFLVVLLLSISAALLFGLTFSSRFNSLEANGRWISVKTTLETHLSGAPQFFSGTEALNRHRLNLGAWHGFHEVLFREPVELRQLDFRFFLPTGGYFYIIFNKDAERFSGLRLSDSPLYENSFVEGYASGRFADQIALSTKGLRVGDWNTGRIVFSTGTVALILNDVRGPSVSVRSGGKSQFGFRGSHREVLIDAVVARTAEGRVIKEYFFNSRAFWACSLVGIFALGLLHALGVAFRVKQRPRQEKDVWRPAVLWSWRLLAVSLLAAFFLPRWDAKHPRATSFLRDLERRERAFLSQAPEILNQEIMEQYGDGKPEGVFRICFLGESQTGGAGVAKLRDMFVRGFERRLTTRHGGAPPIECVNISVAGIDTRKMLPYYEKYWINLQPQMVIVNMSKTDVGDDFGPNLRRIAELNRARRIRTVFVLEPISPEFPEEEAVLSANHRVMRRVGQEYGVPVLDAHGFLKENRKAGIIWWDISHMTTFGHELMADYLYENIKL